MKRILIFALIVALPSLLAAGWLAVEPVAAWEVSSIVSRSQRKPALDPQSRDVPSPLPQLLDEVHWRRESADCQPSYTHYASDSVMKFVRNVENPEEGDETEIDMVGPDGGLEDYVVVIIRFPDLPVGAQLTLYVYSSTVDRWLDAGVEIEGAYLEGNFLIPWEEPREIRLAGLPLEPLEEVPFTFRATGPPGSAFTIDIEQWVNDVLAGGTSFMTRAYYERNVLPPEHRWLRLFSAVYLDRCWELPRYLSWHTLEADADRN